MPGSAFFLDSKAPQDGSLVKPAPAKEPGATPAISPQAAFKPTAMLASAARSYKFPSSRRYLWDRTPSGPPAVLLCKDYVPHIELAPSLLDALSRAPSSSAGRDALPLSASFWLASERSLRVLLQLEDKLQTSYSQLNGAAVSPDYVAVPCSAEGCQQAAPASCSPDGLQALLSALRCSLDRKGAAKLSHLLALACRLTPHRPGAVMGSDMHGALLLPAVPLMATPLYGKRMCDVPLAISLAESCRKQQQPPGGDGGPRSSAAASGSGMQNGLLTMDQARSLVPLLPDNALAYSTPLVGIWMLGVPSLHHPLVLAACLRFHYSSTLPERVAQPDGSFLLLLYSAEGQKVYEVRFQDELGVPLQAYTWTTPLLPPTTTTGGSGALGAGGSLVVKPALSQCLPPISWQPQQQGGAAPRQQQQLPTPAAATPQLRAAPSSLNHTLAMLQQPSPAGTMPAASPAFTATPVAYDTPATGASYTQLPTPLAGPPTMGAANGSATYAAFQPATARRLSGLPPPPLMPHQQPQGASRSKPAAGLHSGSNGAAAQQISAWAAHAVAQATALAPEQGQQPLDDAAEGGAADEECGAERSAAPHGGAPGNGNPAPCKPSSAKPAQAPAPSSAAPQPALPSALGLQVPDAAQPEQQPAAATCDAPAAPAPLPSCAPLAVPLQSAPLLPLATLGLQVGPAMQHYMPATCQGWQPYSVAPPQQGPFPMYSPYLHGAAVPQLMMQQERNSLLLTPGIGGFGASMLAGRPVFGGGPAAEQHPAGYNSAGYGSAGYGNASLQQEVLELRQQLQALQAQLHVATTSGLLTRPSTAAASLPMPPAVVELVQEVGSVGPTASEQRAGASGQAPTTATSTCAAEQEGRNGQAGTCSPGKAAQAVLDAGGAAAHASRAAACEDEEQQGIASAGGSGASGSPASSLPHSTDSTPAITPTKVPLLVSRASASSAQPPVELSSSAAAAQAGVSRQALPLVQREPASADHSPSSGDGDASWGSDSPPEAAAAAPHDMPRRLPTAASTPGGAPLHMPPMAPAVLSPGVPRTTYVPMLDGGSDSEDDDELDLKLMAKYGLKR